MRERRPKGVQNARYEHEPVAAPDDQRDSDVRRRGANEVPARHQRRHRSQRAVAAHRSRDRGRDHRPHLPILLPHERPQGNRRCAAGCSLDGQEGASCAPRHWGEACQALRARRGSRRGPHGALRARRSVVGCAGRRRRSAAGDLPRSQPQADPRLQLERTGAHVAGGCCGRSREAARRGVSPP